MKVLFLSAWYPSRISPFNGDFIERQAQALSLMCEVSAVHVIADPLLKSRRFEVVKEQQGNYFKVIIYYRKSKLPLLALIINKLNSFLAYIIGYRLASKKIGKPDMVHANIISPVIIIAALIGIIKRIPWVVSEHWTRYLTPQGRIHPLLQVALKLSFAVVTVSRNLLSVLKNNHDVTGNFYVVPNVVDTDLFVPDTSKNNEKMQFLHVSSMKEEQKNISGIIRAVKKVSETRKDFHFTFIGEYQDHQVKMAADLGLTDMITYKGVLSYREVAATMKKAHTLVLFSNLENLPCVMLEAFSCGIPVISTNVGGIREWLDDTRGVLIPPGDESALAKAMIYIMDHKDQYHAEILHTLAVKQFSRDTICRHLMSIYKEACDARRYL